LDGGLTAGPTLRFVPFAAKASAALTNNSLSDVKKENAANLEKLAALVKSKTGHALFATVLDAKHVL